MSLLGILFGRPGPAVPAATACLAAPDSRLGPGRSDRRRGRHGIGRER